MWTKISSEINKCLLKNDDECRIVKKYEKWSVIQAGNNPVIITANNPIEKNMQVNLHNCNKSDKVLFENAER